MANQFTFGRAPQQYDPDFYNRLIGELENWSRGLEGTTLAYTPTSFTESRALDASAASLGDLRQVVATLINDLKNLKVIR